MKSISKEDVNKDESTSLEETAAELIDIAEKIEKYCQDNGI